MNQILARYLDPSSLSVSDILGLIQAQMIAIPEIQRPFVWRKTQVRNLLDSLYRGYPAGYIIMWNCPTLKMKDGKEAGGRKILIDGQQRVMALMTAILGREITNENYAKDTVKIAFDPFAALSSDPEAEVFAVQDSRHLKDRKWISDISTIFANTFNQYAFVDAYCKKNAEMNPNQLSDVLTALKAIGDRRIGVIELKADLDIDVVTNIFVRINNEGTSLSQGDFVMSKIAADELHGGNDLRKAIDYFSHLVKYPAFCKQLRESDVEFVATDYMKRIEWLRNDIDSVYEPTCDDVIRVAFMTQWHRAKLSELVGLLSGRDFKDRVYKEEIVEQTFESLKRGVLDVVCENNFRQFLVTIRGAGFNSPKLMNSNMALDFAYTLFLRLKGTDLSHSEAKRIVQKWYVLSILTGRYSGGAPESTFAKDLKQIEDLGIAKTFANLEAATLSEAFWTDNLTQRLSYNVSSSPAYQVYLAAQVAKGDISLLSSNVKVEDLLTIQGDVHHIFPKKYLISHGFQRNQYNQIANFALLDPDVNKSIGSKSPKEYFAIALKQCETKVAACGTIVSYEKLQENLKANCIPENALGWGYDNYADFLEQRRKLMAAKIRSYYESL